uniref:Uncharacterized protein n=1 Tax=Guillardia theta TaxID=55529 RepID=A0A6U6C900_GUITH
MTTTSWYRKQQEHESSKETISFLLRRKDLVQTKNISRLTTKIVFSSLESEKTSKSTQPVQDKFRKAPRLAAELDTPGSQLDPSHSLVSTSTGSASPSKLSWTHYSNTSDFRKGLKQVRGCVILRISRFDRLATLHLPRDSLKEKERWLTIHGTGKSTCTKLPRVRSCWFRADLGRRFPSYH